MRIHLCNGASEAVRLSMMGVIRNETDGVLVPIPQYPLYSAQLTLQKGIFLPYFLDEANNWGINIDEIEAQISHQEEVGITPRAMVVINPGNPTGQVLSREHIESLLMLAHRHNIMILADEVYQKNIYTERPFISFRKVLSELGPPYSNEIELISYNSVSKGLLGECGLRGGYMEMTNLPQQAEEQIYKLKSIELCSNTLGQFAV